MPLEPRAGNCRRSPSPDVQRLPSGRCGRTSSKSAELTFLYVGEHIIHFHPQLFFKHRGMEKRFEGRGLAAA